jgi:GT2 family glycosyltransferase
MSDFSQAAKKTPVAVFLYNRPAYARSLFESLATCERLDDCDVYIYCDGPRSIKETDAVSATRQVANEWANRLGAQVIERAQNLGLSKSIVNGVTELCSKYGRAIVLEDDFILNPSFLNYMVTSLDRYEHEPAVFQISGYMFPVEHPLKPDVFFLPLATTWGWATWHRAWRVFDPSPGDAAEALRDPRRRHKFDLDGSYPYSDMLERRLRNENDSWGVLFWWTVFKAGGLVLHPRESLVWVGGFDRSGTHCGDQKWSQEASLESVTSGPQLKSFELPKQVTLDQAAFARIKSFLRKETSHRSVFARVRHRLASLRLTAG